MTWPRCLPLLPAVLLLASGAAQADTMRCDDKVVRTGDRSFDVERHCGEPSFRDRWDEYPAHHHHPTAHVETWYYNFGPSQLLHVLQFRNGRLNRIDTEGRGFHKAEGECQPGEITRDMSQYTLLSQCGQPEARERRYELRSIPLRHGRYSYPVTVRVDEWIYNFGPSRFIRIVTLVDGRVDDIETGERGY